jgi:ketosteroid isomerase-like protein
MSQENVDVIRTAYARMARGDFRGLASLSDDFELVVSPEVPDAGTYRGEAARLWLQAWVESLDPFTLEATEFIEVGDNVVVEVHPRGRIRGSASEVEGRWWFVHTIVGGDLARLRAFPDRRQALDAAGLRE